jgi:hypothetical protein
MGCARKISNSINKGITDTLLIQSQALNGYTLNINSEPAEHIRKRQNHRYRDIIGTEAGVLF